jgi:hypothetical protein
MATGAGTVGGGGVDSSLSTVAGIDEFHRSLDSNGVGAGKCRASIPRRKKHGQRRLFSVRRRRKTEDGRRAVLAGKCTLLIPTSLSSLFPLLFSLPFSFLFPSLSAPFTFSFPFFLSSLSFSLLFLFPLARYRRPLIGYLNRYAKEAVLYFLSSRRLSNPHVADLFHDILTSKYAGPLR